jgi:DNA-binding MarR family transcriptional regulator
LTVSSKASIPAVNDAPQPRDKLRLKLWLRLLYAKRGIEADLRERLQAAFDSTLPRFDVLATLYRAERGLKMGELSRRLMVSSGNVTGIVDRLVRDGMIVRVPTEGDRRTTLVRLTGKGRTEFSVMAERHEAWINEILSALSDDEVQEMSKSLDKILRTKGTPANADG